MCGVLRLRDVSWGLAMEAGYHACAREYPAGQGTWRMSVRADRSMPFSGTPLISAERPADVFMSSARIIWYLPMKQGGYLQTRHDTANVGAAHLVPLGQSANSRQQNVQWPDYRYPAQPGTAPNM